MSWQARAERAEAEVERLRALLPRRERPDGRAPLGLTVAELSSAERWVLDRLRRLGGEGTISDIAGASTTSPDGQRVRNALRRLLRECFVERSARGKYRLL